MHHKLHLMKIICIYNVEGYLKYNKMSFPTCDMKIQQQLSNIKR